MTQITTPINTGILKINKGIQSGLQPTGYTGGYGVIQKQFGLTPEELSAMLKIQLIVRGQDGWDIDIQKAMQYLKTPPLPQRPAPHSIMPTSLPQYKTESFKEWLKQRFNKESKRLY